MPTTPKGLPYPAPTEAPNIPEELQLLAEALDFTKINLLTVANIPSAASLLSAYPLGLSLLNLAAGDASAGGWPGAASSHVITIKPTSTRAAQYLFLNSATPRAWYRQLVADPGPHSPWSGGSAPYGQYTGTVTLDAVNNPTAAVQRNFPTGRFTQTPRIALSSSTPSVHVGVQAVGPTAVTFVGRNVSTFTSTVLVGFTATQALDNATDG